MRWKLAAAETSPNDCWSDDNSVAGGVNGLLMQSLGVRCRIHRVAAAPLSGGMEAARMCDPRTLLPLLPSWGVLVLAHPLYAGGMKGGGSRWEPCMGAAVARALRIAPPASATRTPASTAVRHATVSSSEATVRAAPNDQRQWLGRCHHRLLV